ncbi:hypothetical protein Cgig2_019558 [Carnegiea gigantea]|uniref:RNI-like superfamily protein n=1 Tax=Carnegiea gigantea TaxID=171969 RepID=A0A9Q1KG90_9CARY|nr:hypothetical protein Cgig2_019558 [Carnegiea gigantea]
MAKGKSSATIAASLQNLHLNSISASVPSIAKPFSSSQSPVPIIAVPLKRGKPPSLVSLCLGVIGKHLEDIIPELDEIAISFPADIKMAIAAIARRRKLLNDNVIISLADASWKTLDISCSDVSDFGLTKMAEICTSLRAVDIRGCPRSNYTARRCLGIFKPELNNAEGDSWEELDTMDITHGGQSLSKT